MNAIFPEPQAKGGAQLVKDLNESIVLDIIKASGPISRVDIARRSQISLPTVCSIVEKLGKRGYVLESGYGDSTGGRRAILYSFNSQCGYLIGIDVGGTKIRAGVTDLEGNIVQVLEVPTPRVEGSLKGEASFEQIVSVIDQLTASSEGGELKGIGLGIAGVVNMQTGEVSVAPGLGWNGFPLRHRLANRYNCPIYIDNDVNIILLGEKWCGAAQQARNAICMVIGTGIGCSLLINGELYGGSMNAAGEIGYFLTDRQALHKSYPGYGYLEAMAAGPGIAERTKAALRKGASSTLQQVAPIDEITAKHVCEAASTGDDLALAIIDETIDHLTVALVNICCLFNPEIVVLGGGVMKSADLFLPRLRKEVETIVPCPPRVELLHLGADAGIIGAVAGVMNSAKSVVVHSKLL